jgi:endonuclease G
MNFMKSIRFILTLLLTIALLCPAIRAAHSDPVVPPSVHMALGNPDNATTNPVNTAHWLSVRDWFALSYNNTWRQPNWVSWRLVASDIGNTPRSPTFYADSLLPPSFFVVKPSDYNGIGYSRGHMCNNEARTCSLAANHSVFTMADMIPQKQKVNAGPWFGMEGECQALALAGDTVFVVCGPVIEPNHTSLGPAAVALPAGCWKVAVVVPPGQSISASDRVIAVLMPNDDTVQQRPADWIKFRVTPAAIEAATGLHFFTSLPYTIAAQFDSEIDTAAP